MCVFRSSGHMLPPQTAEVFSKGGYHEFPNRVFHLTCMNAFEIVEIVNLFPGMSRLTTDCEDGGLKNSMYFSLIKFTLESS